MIFQAESRRRRKADSRKLKSGHFLKRPSADILAANCKRYSRCPRKAPSPTISETFSEKFRRSSTILPGPETGEPPRAFA